ncbi:MAG: C45 family autoproteolytic acyltransferase/hydrolase [Candidatus Hodarchaeota archaeon]
MTEEYQYHEITFEHIRLEGTSYQVGQKQGELIKPNSGAVAFFTSNKADIKKFGFKNFNEVRNLYEDYCPGINDEIEGFADSLDTSAENINFYLFPQSIENCSHLVALSSITEDEHIYMGRSYEWKHDEEDLRLVTTKVKGKSKHLGFSMLLFGRYEGLNDHGLAVTSSGGGAYSAPMNQKGLFFSAAVRSILDNCYDVTEAVELLKNIPLTSSTNFIVADKEGNAALIEALGEHLSVKEIDSNSQEQYLSATNHYTQPDMSQYNKYVNNWLLPNSKTRQETIKALIQSNKPHINSENLMNLLSLEIPHGLCAHYFTDYFGTLWSMVIDVSKQSIEICFGPPTHNEWYSFSLDSSTTSKKYTVTIPNKRISA